MEGFLTAGRPFHELTAVPDVLRRQPPFVRQKHILTTRLEHANISSARLSPFEKFGNKTEQAEVAQTLQHNWFRVLGFLLLRHAAHHTTWE